MIVLKGRFGGCSLRVKYRPYLKHLQRAVLANLVTPPPNEIWQRYQLVNFCPLGWVLVPYHR